MKRSHRSAPLHMSGVVESRLSRLVVVLLAVILTAVVVIATIGASRSNERDQQAANRAYTDQAATAVTDRLASYTEMLYGIRSAFTGTTPGRARFHELVEDLSLDDRLPGVQVVGSASLLTPGEVEAWETATESDVAASGLAYPPLEISSGPVDDEALVIDHLEPQEGNEAAFGLDFLSEPKRAEAAMRARDTGLPAATAPVTLVQEAGDQRAFLIMVPVYRSGAPTGDVAERREAFEGVVYAAFRSGDLVEGVFGPGDDQVVEITDESSGEAVYTSGLAADAPAPSSDNIGQLEVAGRQWGLVSSDAPSVLTLLDHAVPWVTLLGGLCIAVLVGALIRASGSARARASNLAIAMTEELNAITDATSEGIVSVDSGGTIVAWNRGAAEMFGASSEEMIGRPIRSVVPEEYGDAVDAATRRILDGGEDPYLRAGNATAVRADGTRFPVELSVSRWTVRGEMFLTGFVRDQTVRRRVEEQHRRTTELLTAVLGAATEVSIIGTDAEGTITVFNAGAEQMLGYAASEVVHRHTPALFHDPGEVEERAAELGIDPGFDVFVHAAQQGRPETRVWTYVRADGSRLPVELTVTAMRGAGDEIDGFIGLATDITARLAREGEQAAALERERQVVAKLTDLDQVKNDFVSTVSHELRTPLTSIIGYSELLTDELADRPDDPSAQLVGMIDRNAQRLLGLVEDLLTLSRVESGPFRVANERCDVNALLRSVAGALGPLAAESSIELELDLRPVSETLGDRRQLERVFLNVIGNAIKFSGPSSVVRTTTRMDGDEIRIEVEDHGIGIAADEQSQLFTRFFRSRAAERESISGTGLGLAIVADIVERHAGRVSVSSTEGVGTTLTVRLPATTAAEPRPAQEINA